MPVQRALEALRHGNAPRKAYEHMQAGAQGIESVTKSILRYYNKDDSLWREAMENVADAMLILNEEQDAIEKEDRE